MSCIVATASFPGPFMSVKSWLGNEINQHHKFLQSQKSLESELAQCEEQKKVFVAKGNCVGYNEGGGVEMRCGILSAAASEQRVGELTALVQQLRLKRLAVHSREAVSRETWEQVV